ncbi:MAG: TonB-dependent receptor [Candidatus Omnitrophota bacterium]
MRGKVAGGICITVLLVSSLWAAEETPVAALDKIVVTPYRYAESLGKTVSSITVITSDEIKNSNAEKVIDILRPVPGLVVRDWYGNGTKASVDMAGFGEQGGLNVLVLIDGRRANDVDLSGVDWNQIPLEQVERIEIIRGGSAAVLYGDNASSGVINIITKKGSGKPTVNIKTQYGSYDTHKESLSLGGEINDKFSYMFNAGQGATHGYRDNSYEKTTDFSSKLEHKFTDALSVHFNSGFHTSSYGMPASLWQEYIDAHNRRYSKHADDHANNKDYYFIVGGKADFSSLGGIDIDFSYREKTTNSFFLTSGLNTQKNRIRTFGVTPKYTLGNSILGRDNKLIAGIDYYQANYRSDRFSLTKDDDPKSYSRVNKTSVGTYLQDEFSIFDKLTLTGGYRREAVRYALGYHDFSFYNPDIDTSVKPKKEIFNTGLVYNYAKGSSAFFNAGKSFRFPEVDEFTYNDASWQQRLNTDLKPQTSMNYQIGARHKFSDILKCDLSIYRMYVKDEIYYDPKSFTDFWGSWMGKNTNYDKTIHEGVEASFNAKISEKIDLMGNYALTKAYFDGGQYDNNDIPMVPRHKGSVGMTFSLSKDISLNVIGNYVGKRYFLNDQANDYSRLNGYMTADTNLIWRYKDLVIAFGINNIFDRKYSEYAGVIIDNTWEPCSGLTWPAGTKFYYPSAGRNFSIRMDYKF